jgi:hypothetical protein
MTVRLPPQRFVSVGSIYDVGGEDPQALVGSIWGSIAKGLSQLHHSKVVQGAAAGVLSLYGVPPGVTTKAMDMTGDLLDKARAGNPKARARVQEIGRQARSGNPAATRAAAAIKQRNRADRRARAAMDLLHRAQQGNPRASEAVRQIETNAAHNPAAAEAYRTLQTVLDASAGRLRRPAPPARAATQARALPSRQPAPPARRATGQRAPQRLTLENARVVQSRQLPNGRKQLTVDVGGAGVEWLKRQLGYHAGMRTEAESFGLRDAYLLGTTGLGTTG